MDAHPAKADKSAAPNRKRWVAVFCAGAVALIGCLVAIAVMQGCSQSSMTEADAAAFFEKQCHACTAVVARLDEDEVAAQTFTVRYRRSEGAEREAVVLFMRETAAWSVAR